MKKILFAIPQMNSAGTEQAMLNMINVLPKENLDITVALISDKGVWQERIPDYCKVLEIKMPEKAREQLLRGGLKAIIKEKITRGRIFSALSIFIKRKVFKDMSAGISLKWDKLALIEEKYDLAVCYTVHHPFLVRYVASKVNAQKKIAFVHNDFSTTGYKLNRCEGLEEFSAFYAVSENLRNELFNFVNKDKVKVFHNIVPVNSILEKADEKGEVFEKDQNIKLLTIGRLNEQKGIDIAIDCMKLLKKDFENIKWYVIGSGELESKLINHKNAAGLENDFIFLGVQQNPYKYIKQCDIYVQPSRHEGYCTTVNEARVIGKPIVATDVSGTREMLTDGVNGLIVPVDKNSIYKAVKSLIEDNNLSKKLIDNLKLTDFSNKKEMDDFLAFGDII